jgi:hypothetical protein
LTGTEHPTLPEPTPLDACGWCLAWIAEGADRGFIPLRLDADADAAAVSPNPLVVDLTIDAHVVVAVVPPAADDRQDAGLDVVVVLCSDECQDALRTALANDEARSRGDIVPPRTVANEEHLEDEALLKDHCAWCLSLMADDAPVETVSASLSGAVGLNSGMVTVGIAGRSVHAVVPPAGFLAAQDHDVLFVVCSGACATALIEAVSGEKTLRRIH